MTTPAATEAVWPIQGALDDRLTGDAELGTLLGKKPSRGLLGVYDDLAPEGAPYPYVCIGAGTEIPDNAHDGFGAEVTVTLHVWVKERDNETARQIVARLRALLDHQPLEVAGFEVVAVRHELTQSLPDPRDPEVRHLPVRFRITIEQE